MRARTGVLTMIFAAAMAAPAAPAMAQSNPCLALPTDAERLICLRDQRAGSEPELQATAATTAAAPVQAGAPAPARGQSAADACLALPTDGERLSCMRDALTAAESALAASNGGEAEEEDDGFLGLGLFGGGDERPDALVAPPAEFAAGLGAEQLDRRRGAETDEEEIRVPATIVEISEPIPGISQFELDNGQVWRQLSGDTDRVRLGSSDSKAVELYGSWAGGYRMSFAERNLTVQVERVR